MDMFNHYIHLMEPHYFVFDGYQINNFGDRQDRWNVTLALKRDPTLEHIEGMIHIDNIRGTSCTATTLCLGKKITPATDFGVDMTPQYLLDENILLDEDVYYDLSYWTDFPQYQRLFGTELRLDRELLEQKLNDTDCIFFRLKETQFTEPPPKGVTIRGYYYMCYDVEKGEIIGLYHDPKYPDRVQRISLSRRLHCRQMRLV